MKQRSIFSLALAAVFTCGAANASLLDVAFYGTGFSSSAPTGAAVLGQAGDQWNSIGIGNPNVDTLFGPYSLLDTADNPTGITLNFDADGGIISSTTNTQPDPDLTNTYLYNNAGGSIGLTLSGLVPSANYVLVLYVSSDDASGGSRALTGTANGRSFSATGDPQSTFINGENIVELSATTDATGALTISEDNPGNGDGEVDLNGLQLQAAAPEPASLGLIAVGAALLAFRARQRR